MDTKQSLVKAILALKENIRNTQIIIDTSLSDVQVAAAKKNKRKFKEQLTSAKGRLKNLTE